MKITYLFGGSKEIMNKIEMYIAYNSQVRIEEKGGSRAFRENSLDQTPQPLLSSLTEPSQYICVCWLKVSCRYLWRIFQELESRLYLLVIFISEKA